MNFILTIQNNNQNFDIFVMNNENKYERKEFFDCFYSSFGPRYSFDNNWFDWYYLNNPFGICDNYLLINRDKNLVGAFGYAKILFNAQNTLHTGILGINGFINPNYSGRGLYTDLMSNSLNHIKTKYQVGFSFPHGNNIGSIKGHIKSGWIPSKKAIFIKYPIIDLKNDKETFCITETKIEDLVNFDFHKRQSTFFYKNFAWINWRFNERPDKKYGAISIKNDIELISGYLIYTFYSDSTGKRCQVADYEYHSNSDFQQLLNQIINLATANYCTTVEFLVNMEHEDTKILMNKGFHADSEHYIMYIYGNALFPSKIKIEYGTFDVI